MLAASTVAFGAPGYAASSDDDEDRREIATVAGQALASIGGFSAGLFGRMHRDGDFSGCFTKSGEMGDHDEDGIPDEITLELDACPSSSGFGIGTVSGSMHLRDTNRDERSGEFEAELDLKFKATDVPPFDWSSATTWLDGTLRGHRRDEGAREAVISHDLHIRTDLERGGEDHTVESDTSWRVSFDPDEGWGVGDRNAPGNVRIEGTWSFDVDGTDVDADVDTRKPLRLVNTECGFGADEGELAAEFDPEIPHTLRVMWTGCNQVSVNVDVDVDD